MTETYVDTDYIFDTGSDLGRQHMDYLECMLDPPTVGVLEGVDTRRLPEQPGVEIHRHDINEGLPANGPYDVIHARATLVHLPRREEIFTLLVDALAPGGWIVVGDPSDYPRTALAAPRLEDFDLWSRIQSLSHDLVAPMVGMDQRWACQAVSGWRRPGWSTSTGGALRDHRRRHPGCAGARQPQHAGRAAAAAGRRHPGGAGPLPELTRDPRFRAWFYRFVCTRGQKPRV